MTATEPPPQPPTHPPTVEAPGPHVAPRVRRRTLAVLWVVFALWVAALLAMYFGTVYPQRHPKDGRPGIVIPPAR